MWPWVHEWECHVCATNNQLCAWLHRPLRWDDEFHQECTRRVPHSDGHPRWWQHQVGVYGAWGAEQWKGGKLPVMNWCKGMANPILHSELFSQFLSKSFNSVFIPWLHISVCWCSLGWVDIILFKSSPKGTAVTSGSQLSLLWNVIYPHLQLWCL